MAVRASDRVTLAVLPAPSYVRTYYLKQSSTLAPPTIPTTNPPPSPWTTVEPTYTAGSTDTLYTVMLTAYGSVSFEYGPVQKSSSFEAAKQAYNLAENSQASAEQAESAAAAAQAAADAAQSTADSKPVVLFSTAAPSGTAPQGSIWWRWNNTTERKIIGQWQQTAAGTGSTWQSETVASEVIANLDVGKLTAGTAVIAEGVVDKLWAEVVTTKFLVATDKIITDNVIVDNTITARAINTDSLIADQAFVSDLWAEGLTIGVPPENITAGPLGPGSSIQAGTGVAHLQLDQTGLRAWDAGGAETFSIDSATGDVTALGGTFTGATFRTGTSGQRVILDSYGFQALNPDNSEYFSITPANGGTTTFTVNTGYEGSLSNNWMPTGTIRMVNAARGVEGAIGWSANVDPALIVGRPPNLLQGDTDIGTWPGLHIQLDRISLLGGGAFGGSISLYGEADIAMPGMVSMQSGNATIPNIELDGDNINLYGTVKVGSGLTFGQIGSRYGRYHAEWTIPSNTVRGTGNVTEIGSPIGSTPFVPDSNSPQRMYVRETGLYSITARVEFSSRIANPDHRAFVQLICGAAPFRSPVGLEDYASIHVGPIWLEAGTRVYGEAYQNTGVGLSHFWDFFVTRHQ